MIMPRLGRTGPISDALRVAALIDGDVQASNFSAASADPTIDIGLVAVNGSAGTWMRSDAAPALDQSIAPTWTGKHIFSTTADLWNSADLTLYSDAGTSSVLQLDGALGNIQFTNADRWIGLSSTGPRTVYTRGNNRVGLWNATDFVLYSDAGTSSVLQLDGATGNVTLDDGAGDSPRLRFIGGSNDDQVDVYLLDAAGAGASDLVVQLADAAGNSKVLLRDSSPADVIKIDSNGNIELMTDGAWIGQSNGVKLTFDDTNNYLEIKGGYVGIGTSVPLRPFSVVMDSGTSSHTAMIVEDSSKIGVALGALDILGTDYSSLQGYDYSSDTASNLLLQYVGGRVIIGAVYTSTWLLRLYHATDNQLATFESGDAIAKIGLKDNATSNTYSVTLGAEGNDMTLNTGTSGSEAVRINWQGYVGINETAPGALLELGLPTANLQFLDAGTAGASSNAWIYVDVGGTTGYLRVYGSG